MAKKKMTKLDWVAFVLVVVGGLNWGLVGVGNWMGANWDLVDLLLGSVPLLQNLVYLLVGLAAVYGIVRIAKK